LIEPGNKSDQRLAGKRDFMQKAGLNNPAFLENPA